MRRKGAAAVELAVVAPLLLTIALGAIEYGRAIQLHHIATTASQVGARVLAQTGDESQATKTVRNYLEEDHKVGVADQVVSNDINAYTINYDVSGQVCRATVSIDYDEEAWCPRFTYVGGERLTASSAYRMERDYLGAQSQ